jgi:hypothetical protein
MRMCRLPQALARTVRPGTSVPAVNSGDNGEAAVDFVSYRNQPFRYHRNMRRGIPVWNAVKRNGAVMPDLVDLL